jgi:hypothetical protein
LGISGEDFYKVSEMQLSLMHDILHTKAQVTHTWYGFCIRVFTPLGTAVAFSLFLLLLGNNRHKENHSRYSRVDIAVTYVLLVGAVILETTSALRAMFSSWTCALLQERDPGRGKNEIRGTEAKEGSNADSLREESEHPDLISDQGRNVWQRLAHIHVSLRRLVHAADWRKRYWSGSIGQHNLLQLCSRSWASKRSKIARWLGVEDPWNVFAYSFSIPVSECAKQLLVSQSKVLKSCEEDASDSSPDHIRNSRGRTALKNKSRRLYDELSWSVVDLEFHDSILVWHIATGMYLCWYKKQAKAGGGCQDDAHAEAAEGLSNYMLFLLAARTYMLPPPASRNAYVHVCHYLTFLGHKSPDDLADLLQSNGEGLNRGSNTKDAAGKTGDKSRYTNTLNRATQLGAKLIGEEMPAADMLELLGQVWMEMLCYAGYRYTGYSHAKQLSSGGELITVAALLMQHIKRRTPMP